MDFNACDKPSLSSLLDLDGDEVFVDSRFQLHPDRNSTSRSQLRVLRHSDSGGGTSISRSPTTEPSPQRNPESTSPEMTDSMIDDALQTEKDFMDYVLSLPNPTLPVNKPESKPESATPTRKSSSRSCTLKGANKVGLDHLDNLCKLMEQLSDLKEANSRLQKRVQYLEDVKSLHDMYEESKNDDDEGSVIEIRPRRTVQLMEDKKDSPRHSGGEFSKTSPSRSQDRRFHSTIQKSKTQPNMTQKRSRERSKSVGHEHVGEDNKSKKRFPKWSRVKEALGLERSHQYEARGPGNGRQVERKRSGARHKMSELPQEYSAGTRRVLSEDHVAALRIPVYCDDMDKKYDASPCDSFASDMTGEAGSIANKGSLEELNLIRKSASKRQLGSGSRRSLAAPDDYHRRRKSSPSPTSITKISHDEIPLQQEIVRSHALDSGVDRQQSLEKLCKEDCKKSNKGPWGRVKTIIQTRRDSLKRKQRKGEGKLYGTHSEASNLEYLSHEGDFDDYCQDLETLSQSSERRSTDVLYDPDDHRSASRKSSTREPPKPIPKRGEADTSKDRIVRSKDKKPKPLELRDEPGTYSESDLLEDDSLQSPSSPTSQRRSRWTRMRRVFGKRDQHGRHLSRSAPSSPTSSVQERSAFDFENLPDIEDDASDAGQSHSGRHPSTESGGHPLMSCASSPVTTIFHELQNNLSEDFNKKIMEWERMRSTGGKCPLTNSPVSSATSKADSAAGLSRVSKNKTERRSQEKLSKQRLKDLNWLEKELQKVERETHRLAKEKQKYEEKAARLQKLKETVISARNTNRNEVLIRTSAGEFRFEGISDAFTKKLYEWETKRGVGPDMSTIALLDSNQASVGKKSPDFDNSTLPLQHVLSKSESSVIDTGQPSQTSSNSLPSLKQQDSMTLERLQPSRANSEPDLGAYSKELLRAHTPRIELAGSASNIMGSCDSEKVTQLLAEAQLVEDSQADLTDDFNISQVAEESYYNLLEENMFLLEQLKDKEDICKRLENEIQYLDTKMVDMKTLHQDEMGKYRENMWEVHRPGSKPNDLEGSLKKISAMKYKIDDLEKNSDRMKSERQNLEDSFRFHSEQQAQLAIDLSQKMKELQDTRVTGSLETQDEWKSRRFRNLHELSSVLLKQARHLERALAERTRQVCHLRWELLNRDVSRMPLQMEPQTSRWKSTAAILVPRPTQTKVSKSKRYWSSTDAIALIPEQGTTWADYSSERRLESLSTELFKDCNKVDYHQPTGLSPTIHALKMELLKLSSKEELLSEDEYDRSVSRTFSEQSEITYERPHTSATGHSTPPEAETFGSICSSPGSIFPSMAPEIKVRRNSADNFSSVSGPECSESSSLNENVSFVLTLPSRRWAADNMSSSSESSYMDHYDIRTSWSNSRSRLKVPAEFSSEDNIMPEESRIEDITLKYPSSLKRSRVRKDWSRNSAYRERDQNQEEACSEFSSEDQTHSDGFTGVSCPQSPVGCQTFFTETNSNGLRGIERGDSFKVIDTTRTDSPSETPTFTVVLPRRSLSNKGEVEGSLKPTATDHQRSRASSPKGAASGKDDVDTDVESRVKKDFQNLNVHRDSPVIKSRSHRKLKSENSKDKSDSEVGLSNAMDSSNCEDDNLSTPTNFPTDRTFADPRPNETPIASPIPTPKPRTEAQVAKVVSLPSSSNRDTIKGFPFSSEDSIKSDEPVRLVKCKTMDSFHGAEISKKDAVVPEQETTSKHKGFLKLKLMTKRAPKKQEASTVGALCRQSLLMNIDDPESAGTKKDSGVNVSAKSCPSSPEPKQKNKGGWFSKGLFKR